MTFLHRAPSIPSRKCSALASQICSGLILLLCAGASASAVDPLHPTAPTTKAMLPPVLSIGTVTIAPPAADAGRSLPANAGKSLPAEAGKPLPAAPKRSARTQTRRGHKLGPGDLMLPTYTLDRA